jgi:hypothetical protein
VEQLPVGAAQWGQADPVHARVLDAAPDVSATAEHVVHAIDGVGRADRPVGAGEVRHTPVGIVVPLPGLAEPEGREEGAGLPAVPAGARVSIVPMGTVRTSPGDVHRNVAIVAETSLDHRTHDRLPSRPVKITLRFATAVLAGVSLMGLTACSEEPATTTADKPAPAATTTAAAAPETSTAPAAAALSDKELCQEAGKASDAMQKTLMAMIKANPNGEFPAADSAAMLNELAANLNKAAEGGASEVAKGMQTIAAQSIEAAKATNPTAALDTPESTKAGTALNAACKKVGVTVKY